MQTKPVRPVCTPDLCWCYVVPTEESHGYWMRIWRKRPAFWVDFETYSFQVGRAQFIEATISDSRPFEWNVEDTRGTALSLATAKRACEKVAKDQLVT